MHIPNALINIKLKLLKYNYDHPAQRVDPISQIGQIFIN